MVRGEKDVGANVLYRRAGVTIMRHCFAIVDGDAALPGSRAAIRVRTGSIPRNRATARADMPCEIDGLAGDRAEIAFAEPQWALTQGQSVVVYESKVCLGGGVIDL